MNQPLVTIIVVSYNHAKYIPENLENIKNQTYGNIQLIVGDDASADNSVEVFEQWLQQNNYSAEKNFHTQNTGFAEMLNECIELAKGEYIKVLAADDYLHPEAIQKCVEKLESCGESYGMVYSNTHAINDDSEIIDDLADYDAFGTIDPETLRKDVIKYNRIPALTVVMRTKVLHETGKYDAQFIAEDYYRWLKIREKYMIAYIPEKLAYYRVHTGNISKLRAERLDNEFTMLQMMFDTDGTVRNKVNGFIQDKYLAKKEIPKDLFELYKNYPFNVKRLVFCIQYHIPPKIFEAVCKFI
ncbi:glycosyltransferase [Chryseobacterium sp.]|uniref:glycosyltransferase family 2 protein n=1 Tax=Chryseobacterium sp. TaxID=1871047 RepID=UPI00289704E4|nr:glycosyltransferase [Chryseobacterium sp.]